MRRNNCRPWWLLGLKSYMQYDYMYLQPVSLQRLTRSSPYIETTGSKQWKGALRFYTVIHHFAVVYSVLWPLNSSEAGGELVFVRYFFQIHCIYVTWKGTKINKSNQIKLIDTIKTKWWITLLMREDRVLKKHSVENSVYCCLDVKGIIGLSATL